MSGQQEYLERRRILDALDLPPELEPLQLAYHERRREFLRLEEACVTVVEFCLEVDAARVGSRERKQT